MWKKKQLKVANRKAKKYKKARLKKKGLNT